MDARPHILRHLDRNYGGKRAFLHHLVATVRTQLPNWRSLCRVDWSSVDRLVFVCKGNICRSPYAAAKAASLGFFSASAGLDTQHGRLANNQARCHGALRDIYLDDHRTMRIQDLAINARDLLVCMEPLQVKALRAILPTTTAQLTLLGLWSRPRRPWIFDPYGRNDGYWSACFSIIDNAIERMAFTAWLKP